MRKQSFFATAIVAVFLAQGAYAARPLDTDDAGVISAGSCELEAARVLPRTLGVKSGESGAALACGVGWASQVGLGLSQARVAGEDRSRGAAILFKRSLWSGEGDNAPALSLGGALAWGKPPGGKWATESREIRLLGTLPWNSLFFHANLGHARSPNAGTRATLWGLAAELEPVPVGGFGLAPLVEVFGDDHGDRWANVGLRLTVVPDQLFVDFAVARQLVADKTRALNAGFKLAF